MKGSPTWTAVALSFLLISSASCGGEGGDAAPPTPTPALQQPPPTEPGAGAQQAEEQGTRQGEEARRAEDARREEQERRPTTYSVERGDHLWGISGQARIYGDPRFWPLLYDANRDAITDPDLIFPDRQLEVPRPESESERERRLFALWRELG